MVEGRYDKNALKQAVDAVVLETRGFGVFRDEELRALLRRLADKRGIIVLTDSDSAGFLIRNHLKGILPPGRVKHAFIPDIPGKERRKRAGSAEGKLGVEGMSPEALIKALLDAGATVAGEHCEETPRGGITKADMFALGLSGSPDSAQRRAKLLKKLALPEHMTANALLETLNLLYTKEEASQLTIDN